MSLLVTAGHLRQALDEACETHGVTHDQYNVLRILRGVHPNRHPRREIEDRMIERSPVALTVVVQMLYVQDVLGDDVRVLGEKGYGA